MSNEVDSEILTNVILKLLDKAGHNPLLTARKLRAKAEEKIFGKENFAGKLKSSREKIKDIIMLWDEKEKERETSILKLLLRISKVGQTPAHVLKGLSDISSRSDRIIEFRKRLREHGCEFSDIPTEEEILAIEKKAQEKKDTNGGDSASETKKRKNDEVEADPTTSSSSAAAETPSKAASQPVAKKIKEEQPTIKKEPKTSSDATTSSSTKSPAPVPAVVPKISSPPKPAKKIVYTKEGDDDEF